MKVKNSDGLVFFFSLSRDPTPTVSHTKYTLSGVGEERNNGVPPADSAKEQKSWGRNSGGERTELSRGLRGETTRNGALELRETSGHVYNSLIQVKRKIHIRCFDNTARIVMNQASSFFLFFWIFFFLWGVTEVVFPN